MFCDDEQGRRFSLQARLFCHANGPSSPSRLVAISSVNGTTYEE